MSAIQDIVGQVPLPRMVRIRQHFAAERLEDVPSAVQASFLMKNWGNRLRPGMEIAVTAGSRGIANMPLVLREVCSFLKSRGCRPFLVPVMGSHGGSTAGRQIEVLHALGITEEVVGAPIRSSMETVCLYEFPDHFKVYVDANAMKADGIVVNRIKPHTSFRGSYESGLMKMMTVGLGKQVGADQIHALGAKKMGGNIERGGRKILECANILCGVALLENGYDQTCGVEVLYPDEILEKEPLLLKQAKENMPRILFESLDVLIVDYIGKNISGPGMDPNITFTFTPGSGIPTDRRARRIAVLDLTEESHGSASGMGNADFISRRVFEKADLSVTYPNLLTAGFPEAGKIPMMMDNHRMTIQAALKTTALKDLTSARIVRIPNTLHLGEIQISETLLSEAQSNPNVEIVSGAEPFAFDADGNLF